MKVSPLFDQYPAAGFFPPFPASRRASDGMRGRSRHLVIAAVTFGPLRPIHQQLAATVGYAVAERAEPVTRQTRHRSTNAQAAVSALGDTHVLH